MEEQDGVATWKLLRDESMISHPALIVLKDSSCLFSQANRFVYYMSCYISQTIHLALDMHFMPL